MSAGIFDAMDIRLKAISEGTISSIMQSIKSVDDSIEARLAAVGLASTSACQWCQQARGTAWHRIWECPRLEARRDSLLPPGLLAWHLLVAVCSCAGRPGGCGRGRRRLVRPGPDCGRPAVCGSYGAGICRDPFPR